MASTEGSAWRCRLWRMLRRRSILAALVDAYSTLLFRIANSVLRSRTEAEDVVQMFSFASGHRLSLATVRDMRVWLIRIAWNLALDRKRRSGPNNWTRISQIAGQRNHAGGRRDGGGTALSTRPARIERLPKAERHVLLLSALEELGTQRSQ